MPQTLADAAFWTALRTSLERLSPYAAITLALIAAFTFAQGSHAVSYVFLLVAYVFATAFLAARLAHRHALRNIALATLSVALLAWLVYNLSDDARTRGSFDFTPARSGETLIVLTEFDRRGTRALDIRPRLREALDAQLQSSKLPNVRIETLGAGQARVGDRTTARALGARYHAAFVLWGWYDDVAFHPDLVVATDSRLEGDVPRLTDFSATDIDSAFLLREASSDELAFVADIVVSQALMRAGRLGDANDLLADAEVRANAAKIGDGLDSLYFLRGAIQQLLGAELNLVIDAYSHALELNPDFAAAYYDRWVARAARGDAPDQVFADYAHAVDLEPRVIPFAYFSTRKLPAPTAQKASLDKLQDGIGAYTVRDYDSALADFDDVLALEPGFSGAYYFRARVYHVRREYQAAIDDYTRFLDAAPNAEPHYVADAFFARAIAHRSLNQRDLASRDLDAYLRSAPADDSLRAEAELYKNSR